MAKRKVLTRNVRHYLEAHGLQSVRVRRSENLTLARIARPQNPEIFRDALKRARWWHRIVLAARSEQAA